MPEEAVVAFAQVIQSRFPVGRGGKAVLGAFPVAGEQVFAFAALAGQAVPFGLSEGQLSRAVHHLHERLPLQVAQFIFGKYKVVATVNITVELHDAGMAARLGHGTESGLHTDPVGQGSVEQLYEGGAHVLSYPFIEDGAQEMAPLFGRDGKVGQGGFRSLLR